jgi:hemolysin-activating ACP:hemolysin acyltransferase
MPSERTAEYVQKLGLAATVMGQSPLYCQYPIACIPLWLEPAIRHDQIYFFSNHGGLIVGYMTWAWLTAETEHRWLTDPNVLLHISEWNEGDRLWITDFVVQGRSIRSCLREAASFLAAAECAKSVRRLEDGIVRKVSTWSRAKFVSS